LETLQIRKANEKDVGTILKFIKGLAEIAVERNCGRFEWSVLDWNKPAIDFYKSLGAKPIEEWTVFRLDGEALNNLAGVKK
jgi:RimJ/RimL family protein N-acetyltransferase